VLWQTDDSEFALSGGDGFGIARRGGAFEEILAAYPNLNKEDWQACLLFAGQLVKVNSIHKFMAA
jgi:hypothetical protein